MAGTALTSRFMLGSATVMLGPMTDLFNLTPALHSIGLVKNFSLTNEPSSVELTQGILNNVVMSVVNGSNSRAQMEVYEYTAKNLAYGLGLDGSTFSAQTVATTLSGAVTGPTSTVAVTSGTGLVNGDHVMLVDSTADDIVFTRKITAGGGTASLTVTPAFGTGIVVPIGSAVHRVNMVPQGNPTDGLFLGAKVVGILADGTKCQLLFPKVRITRGFALAFQTDSFGSMPYEFRPISLVSTDVNYSDFGANVSGHILVRG